MTGGLGNDTFVWRGVDASAVDTITDFTAGASGDVLDLRDLLIGTFTTATDYVSVRESGGNTILSVDRDGAGTTYGYQDVAVLENVTGETVSSLLGGDNLLVNP